jgi:hypothetical protein
MSKALIGNAADAEQVKKAEKKAKIKHDQELADIAAVMSTEAGRRFMWRLINDICHYDTLSATHSGSFTYMNEGERNVGRIIKGECYEAAFETYQLMEKERMAEKLGEKGE